MSHPHIVLFTDFGLAGPYVGQMQAVLARVAPAARVINLFADLPPFDARGAAYLLPAYTSEFPAGTVFLGVVDPGVGSRRRGAVLRADGCWFVGPDNGLFNMVARRARDCAWWDIDYQPPQLSASFHGRDIFAPVAAMLACGETVPGTAVDPMSRIEADWPDDLARVVYIDHFGNAITGLRADAISPHVRLWAKGRELAWARTFSAVNPGQGFWYKNANGLVEIAANQARADESMGLRAGDPVDISQV